MNTFFASPERLTEEDIRKQFLYASNNPVMDAVLNAGAGLLAILNAHRQILTVNRSLLEFLNVDSPKQSLDCDLERCSNAFMHMNRMADVVHQCGVPHVV